MQATSKQWQELLAGTLTAVESFYMTVYEGLNGAVVYPALNITKGTITADLSSSTRRTAEMVVPDPTSQYVPKNSSSVLMPLGHTFQVFAGYVFNDGTKEHVPLGYFEITSTEIDYDPQNGTVITIRGSDLTWRMARDKFLFTRTFTAGTGYTQAIQTLLILTLPTGTYSIAPSSVALASDVSWDPGTSNLTAIQQLCGSIGMELFIDVNGVAVVQPVPNPTQQPTVWNIGGDPQLFTMKRTLDAQDTYNTVLVVGDNQTLANPVYGYAQDINPNSPTYIKGPMGRAVYFLETTAVGSTADAQNLANTTLTIELGLTEELSVDIRPNYALDLADVVSISEDHTGTNSAYQVESFSLTFGGGGSGSTPSSASGGSKLSLVVRNTGAPPQ
jgi:hypothetical protein